MSAEEGIKEDAALARSRDLQFKLISAAYESKDEEKIDMALYRVTTVRRMLANGLLELIEEVAEAEEREIGSDGTSEN